MSMQTRENSLSSKKCQKQFSAKHFDQKCHQQMDAPHMPSPTLEATSTQSKECLRNTPQIHIIHISDLTSILNEMITTFEAQSLLSGSPLLCLDMDNMPQLLRHIIKHRCHNIPSKELPANNVPSDDEGLSYESDAESSEVCWSSRDAQSAQKTFAPGSKCKTKKRGPVSISKDEVVALVSRIMQRSRNLPKKSFPILNLEDLPDLILQEEITPRPSENSICLSEVLKLILEVMDGEISVPMNDIFVGDPKNQGEDHREPTEFSARANNRKIMPQRKSILEDCSQLKQEVNKQNADSSATEDRRKVEAPFLSPAVTTNEQRKDMMPPEYPPPKPSKTMPGVSSIFGDICWRSSKRYMDPTIASTARATFDDPLYPPTSVTKKYPGNALSGISKVRGVTAVPAKDRCVPPENHHGTARKQRKHTMRGRRYRLKECKRPWDSPFYNPNQLFCLEEVTKVSYKKTKGETRLVDELLTERSSPRLVAAKGDVGEKVQVSKSEGSLVGEDRAEGHCGARSRSEGRLIRAAERLKMACVPTAKMPDWNPATCSPREEVISIQNENGMKIIDKMIKPKKLSKAFRTKH